MLDKISEREQQTRICTDCGCSFVLLPVDSVRESSSSSHASKSCESEATDISKCPSCRGGDTSGHLNGRRPHRRPRLDPHCCSVCSKTFITSAHLAVHMASHSKERKFRCNICHKYFHQSAHLVAHKKIHTGDRPFKCPDCGRTFGRASHLKTHRRLHTGEKPFTCMYCSKSFTQKAGLLAHVRLHTTEKIYRCKKCGEGFGTVGLLVSHKAQGPCGAAKAAPPAQQPQDTESSTDEIKCGVCCRTFMPSSYIRLRVRLRKGQRPYHCKVCNKTFVKLETFVNHCDQHLVVKKEKNKEAKGKVVKPPLFVPLSQPPSPHSLTSHPVSTEVGTRSKAKAKIKIET